MAKLTPKQQRFVQEYLIDLNATQAAIRAGYSKKTAQQVGSQNLLKLVIAEAIQNAKDKREERTLVTQDMVIKGLLSEAEFVGEGSSHSARVGAWAHLGKHLNMFIDKKEISGELTVKQAKDLTDDELKVELEKYGIKS